MFGNLLVAWVEFGTANGTVEIPSVICSDRNYTHVCIYVVLWYLCSCCLDSLGFFPAAVVDRVLWPGEHTAELGLLALARSLPGLQKQTLHFIEGCFASRPLRFHISP